MPVPPQSEGILLNTSCYKMPKKVFTGKTARATASPVIIDVNANGNNKNRGVTSMSAEAFKRHFEFVVSRKSASAFKKAQAIRWWSNKR